MKRNFLHLIFLFLSQFFAFQPAQAQQQNTYYVYNGTTLEAMFDNLTRANPTHWRKPICPLQCLVPQHALF